jgi:3-oxoacyl-[acyl-carrier protein] reductase
MARLSGKVAIVTGASSGIGRAIAERLSEDGALVVIHYATNAEKAEQVAAGIQAKGGKALTMQADIRQVAEARRLVAETLARFSRLNILVNNAGKFLPKAFLDTTEEEFDAVMALHARGPYFATQQAARVMKDGGRIVNISTAGTHMHFPGATAHLASKAALEQLTKGLALELAPRGITVNAVAPGITDTGVLTEPYRQMGVRECPLGRLGAPKDIADVVAFLVSEEARWVTGQTIQAGGGMVM